MSEGLTLHAAATPKLIPTSPTSSRKSPPPGVRYRVRSSSLRSSQGGDTQVPQLSPRGMPGSPRGLRVIEPDILLTKITRLADDLESVYKLYDQEGFNHSLQNMLDNVDACLTAMQGTLEQLAPCTESNYLRITDEMESGEFTSMRLCAHFATYQSALQISEHEICPGRFLAYWKKFYTIEWQWFCGPAKEKEEKVAESVKPYLPSYFRLKAFFTAWFSRETLREVFLLSDSIYEQEAAL